MSALTGFRVVELAGSVAGEYCGKLLADFGAEVIKVETPGWGSPTRAMAPIVRDVGPEGSALFAYLNTNKHSVELDVTSAVQRRSRARTHRHGGCGHRRPHDSWARTASECGVLLDHSVRPGCTG